MPVGRGWMNQDRTQVPGLAVTNTANSVFCTHDSFELTAQITAAGGAIPPGNITFITWEGGVATTQGTGAINPGTGVATYTVPANTFVSGDIYYIQASYPGSGTYGPQITPANTAGTKILPTHSLVTASAITTYPVSPFCIYSNETVTVTVTATGTGSPPNPTDGTVTVYTEGDGGPYSLGSAALSGSNSVVVPLNDGGLGWNWPYVGTFAIWAVYGGDGTCYAASPQSPDVNLTTFVNTVSMFAPNGPTKLCNGDGANVSYTCYVFSDIAGTITGTFELLSNESGLLSSQTTSVPYTGQTLTFTFSDFNFGTAGNQNVYCNFQPNTTAGCYSPQNSPLSANIDVVNSTTQNAGIAQVGSGTNGFSYGSGTTGPFSQETGSGGNATTYFRADVTRTGSQAGTTSGTVYWYISNSPTNITTSGIFFTNVFFTDSGTSTITPQATLPAGFTGTYYPFGGYGNFYVQAQFTGNGCYGAVNSNVIELEVSEAIH